MQQNCRAQDTQINTIFSIPENQIPTLKFPTFLNQPTKTSKNSNNQQNLKEKTIQNQEIQAILSSEKKRKSMTAAETTVTTPPASVRL